MKQNKKDGGASAAGGAGGRDKGGQRGVFKKSRANGKVKLPGQLALDDKIVSKIKFDKAQTKKGKLRLEKPTQLESISETGNNKKSKIKKAKSIPASPFHTIHLVDEEKKEKIKPDMKAAARTGLPKESNKKTDKKALPKLVSKPKFDKAQIKKGKMGETPTELLKMSSNLAITNGSKTKKTKPIPVPPFQDIHDVVKEEKKRKPEPKSFAKLTTANTSKPVITNGTKTKKAKPIAGSPFKGKHEGTKGEKKWKPEAKSFAKATNKTAPSEVTDKMDLPKGSTKKSKPGHKLASELAKVAKSSQTILPSKYVTPELITKAVMGLQQLATQQKNKNKMFEDEANVFVQIMCIKIQNKSGNIRFTLPHSTVATTGEVCLITSDLKKGRKPDHEPTIEHWEEILRNAGVTGIKTVLPMRQLRVEYDQYELKRRLLTQHDFIMVDSRVLSHVSHELSKPFFKKHNMLVSVRLHDVQDIKKSIEKSLKTTMLRLNEGATSSVLVGHMGMSLTQIEENILALVKQIGPKFPGGEQNIRSLSIKLPLSLSLPLYVTLRPKRSVAAPRLHTDLPKQHLTIEGELSTIPGSIVKVSPGGTVILKRGIQKHDDSDMIKSDDEEEESEGKPQKKIKMNPLPEKVLLQDVIPLAGSGSDGASDSVDSDASEAGDVSGSEEGDDSENAAEEASASDDASAGESDDESE